MWWESQDGVRGRAEFGLTADVCSERKRHHCL